MTPRRPLATPLLDVCLPGDWSGAITAPVLVIPEFRLTDLFPPTKSGQFDLRINIHELRTLKHPEALATMLALFQDLRILWLDLGNTQVIDWATFRGDWQRLLEAVKRRAQPLKGIGLAGKALLIPSSELGHLAPEFVFGIDPSLVGAFWAGIPISPRHASLYAATEHWVRAKAYGPLAALRRLGIHIQGTIDDDTVSAMVSFSARDLPGDSPSARLLNYLRRFPELEAVRFSHSPIVPTSGLTKLRRAKWVRPTRLPARPPAKIRSRPRHPVASPQPAPFWQQLVNTGTLTHMQLVELFLVARGLKRAMQSQCPPSVWPQLQIALQALALPWTTCVRSIPATNQPEDCRDERFFYVGMDQASAEQAMAFDTVDDDKFGEVLGYPACCRAAFRRNWVLAGKKHNNVAPLVVDQTVSRGRWPFTVNLAAHHFDASIIEFFPCSMDCGQAREYGRTAYREIGAFLPAQARRLRGLLRSPAVHTEYAGVHLLVGAKMSGAVVRYDPRRLLSTAEGPVATTLRAGNSLLVETPRSAYVLLDRKRRQRLDPESVVFTFADKP